MAITQAPHVQKRPGPGKGNHRTGAVRGTHSGIRRGTLPAEKDPEIHARIEQAQSLALQGMSVAEIAALQNVSVETVYADKRRAREFLKERVLVSKADVVAGLELVIQRALRLLEETGNQSLNKSAYLSVIRQALMDQFKVGGLESAQKVEVMLRNGDLEHLDEEIERRLRQRMDALAGKPRLVVESTNGVAKLGPGRTEAP